jgi:hypothetical protein
MISEGIVSGSFQYGALFGLVLAGLVLFVVVSIWRGMSRRVNYRVDDLPEVAYDEYYPIHELMEYHRRGRRNRR